MIDIRFIDRNFSKLLTYLSLFSLALFICSFYSIFFEVPDDYLQKELVKIMYIHVPAAWMSLMLYSLLTLSSSIYLITKNPLYDILASSFALCGFIMTLVTLATGSIWGKPAWGTYWVWDARLTSMLILSFIYLIYILLRNSLPVTERRAAVTSYFAIFGFINIPIIKFSVDIWNTLHQPASVFTFSGPTIHSSMLYPLLMIFFAYLSFSFAVVVVEMKTEIYLRKLRRINI